MKVLMKVISILLLITMVVLILPTLGIEIDLSLALKITELIIFNLLPILSIVICCYCLERNDENYLLRIIPIYMAVYIGLSLILVFLFDAKTTNGAGEIIYNIMNFMSKPHLALTFVSLTFIIKPNNVITTVLKKIAYGLIIVNVVLMAWTSIKEQMEEKLPNVYNYDGYYGEGFNFTSISSTKSFANKFYDVSLIGEVFIIMLLFTTNYAFSTKVEIEADDINYDVLKKEAEELAKSQMNANTSFAKEEKVIDRSQSEKGLMNVNNQLGNDSNVGKVKESAKEIKIQDTSMDAIMPLSKGPVANQTTIVNQQQVQTQSQVPQQTPQLNQMQQNPLQPTNQFQQANMGMQNNQNQMTQQPTQNKFL